METFTRVMKIYANFKKKKNTFLISFVKTQKKETFSNKFQFV